MAEHKWAPPEHIEGTLNEPDALGPEHIEGLGERLATPRPGYPCPLQARGASAPQGPRDRPHARGSSRAGDVAGPATAGVALAHGRQESDAERAISEAGLVTAA